MQDAGRRKYTGCRTRLVYSEPSGCWVASFCRRLQTCMWKTKLVGICPGFIGSYEGTIGEEPDAK